MKNLLLFLLSIHICADITLPECTQQLIVVSSVDFNSTKARLQAYERRDNSWEKRFAAMPVNLGRSGLAWGRGIHTFRHAEGEPSKMEGDGKSPAGLFRLDHFFGYEAKKFNFPYLQVSFSTLCIDESASLHYNHILDSYHTKQYKSFEYMKRKDNLYKLGIVVGHNKEGVKKAGSCIFMHIQKSENSPTSGCTSLQEDQLLKLMQWLDKSKCPLLLQVPKPYLEDFK